MSADLLDRIAAELGPRDTLKAIAWACIAPRLHEKYPDRAPSRDEVRAECEAWAAEVRLNTRGVPDARDH